MSTQDNPYIFVSYCHENKKEALEILENLKSRGYRIWYDENLTAGSELNDEIAEKIDNASIFIGLLSDEYFKSNYCKDELDYARDLVETNLYIHLTPNVKIPKGFKMRIKRFKHIFFDQNDFEALFNKINKIPGIENCITYSKSEFNAEIEDDYLKNLYNNFKILEPRDTDEIHKLVNSTEETDVADLYIIPSFVLDSTSIKPINSHKKFSHLITAVSGSGKSTFIKSITTAIAEKKLRKNSNNLKSNRYDQIALELGVEKNFFPIIIFGSDLNKDEYSDLENLTLENLFSIKQENIDLFKEILKSKDKNNEILLLIDALDEIEGREKKIFLGKEIDRFINEFPNTNLLITSRPIDLTEFRSNNFYQKLTSINLELFNKERIKELIKKWAEAESIFVSDKELEERNNFFLNNIYLSDLIRNPYMLTHSIRYKTKFTKATPQELISNIIDKLIDKRWSALKKYQQFGITSKNLRKLMARLAWNMAYNQDDYIRKDELIEKFYLGAQDIKELSNISSDIWQNISHDMNAEAGLLILDESGYSFQNNEIKNYLASEYKIIDLNEKYGTNKEAKLKIFNDFKDLFDDKYIDQNWDDIILMIFSPNRIYQNGRYDKISPALFEYLLYRSAETLNVDEIKTIGNIFINLVLKTFGNNTVTKIKKGTGGYSLDKQRIIRFLYNNRNFFPNLDKLFNTEDFIEDYNALIRDGLIKDQLN